jgi:hypothetical protein
MEKKAINPATIIGWGMDTDPLDEPNYPIKKYTGDDHRRKNWTRPTLQIRNGTEILKSTERPSYSAVFGTELEPRGLSGALRRFAFRYSENMYRHWLLLLAADRVDVIESSLSDLLHGRIPRVFAERGWGALAKHHPWLLVRKIVVRLLLLGLIVALGVYMARRNKQLS